MNRRNFIKGMGGAAITLGWAPEAVLGQQSRNKVVVVVFQRGAVDGLNMVIPFAERAYYDRRPNLAIPQPGSGNSSERTLDLDDFFGFHPVMQPLEPLFRSEQLAVIHAAGSPDPTRSHFDAQDYMESATPGVKSTRDGWMNRYLQTLAPGEMARGVKCVSLSDEILHDHFPDHPIMPGLLVLEAAAQLGGFLIEMSLNRESDPLTRALLVQIDAAVIFDWTEPLTKSVSFKRQHFVDFLV